MRLFPSWRGGVRTLACALALLGGPVHADLALPRAPHHLRIVGGLAGLNQFTRHEEPFWSRELARLSRGHASAEIVPFDRAGIRSDEMLRLVHLGAVPFGSVQISQAATVDPELMAVDLAGLNPDIATLRRSVAAFRPTMERLLRERYGSELLALYAYPAQVTWCRQPLARLADLAGRRVRTSSPTQADWAAALGATPVVTPFAEIAAHLRDGNIDCAITGTMSGNTIGLHELTTHLHASSVGWGLSAFVANAAAWRQLPPDLQALLRTELPRLEQRIWDEAAGETGDGIACSVGQASCAGGRRGRMTLVREGPADAQRRRQVFTGHVLPAWLRRCGQRCGDLWARTLGPVHGLELP
jgi:TRAP-type C4-dicarboxylate transport system substrate-binding protein